MKKLLLGTLLASTAVPALAGPILDELSPKGMTWTAQEETVSDLGEAYSGVVLTRGNWTAEIAELAVTETGSVVSLVMDNGKMTKSNGDETSFEALSLTFDPSALDELVETFDIEMAGNATTVTPEICAKLDAPFEVSGKALAVKSLGSTMSIDSMSSRYDLIGPETNCIVDLDVALAGVSMVEKNGTTSEIGTMKIAAYSPLRADQPVTDFSRDFSADIAITDLVLGYGGAEQAHIANISSTSVVDVKSMAGLASSGYHELTGDVISAQADTAKIDFSKFSLPKIWNAMRDVNAEGTLKISDAKITGQMPQMITGSEVVAPGRDLNFLTAYEKSGENIDFGLDLSSSDLLDVGFDLHLVMDVMDESLASSGPSAMMMTMPISLAGAKVAIHDQGLGAHAQNELGMDPYGFIGPMVSGNLGPTKGEMVSGWFAAVRNGGASIHFAPAAPMPLMMAFAGFMGDWTSFGKMMNAEVTYGK